MLEAISCTGGETARRDDKWLFHPSQGTGEGCGLGEMVALTLQLLGIGGQQEVTQPQQLDVPSAVKGA